MIRDLRTEPTRALQLASIVRPGLAVQEKPLRSRDGLSGDSA